MTTAVYEIPGMRLVGGLNARELHWVRAKRVKHERQAGMFVLLNRGRPALPVVVRLVRIAPRAFDGDNLQGAFKAIRDGIADAYRIPDNDPRIQFEYHQERGEPKQYAVRIEVSPA